MRRIVLINFVLVWITVGSMLFYQNYALSRTANQLALNQVGLPFKKIEALAGKSPTKVIRVKFKNEECWAAYYPSLNGSDTIYMVDENNMVFMIFQNVDPGKLELEVWGQVLAN